MNKNVNIASSLTAKGSGFGLQHTLSGCYFNLTLADIKGARWGRPWWRSG